MGLEGSPCFADFFATNQDKIHKTLSTTNKQARQDVRAELAVARAILEDGRFAIAFEATASGRSVPTSPSSNRAVTQARYHP